MEAGRLTDIAIASKAYWGYSREFMAACRLELTVTPENIESNQHYIAAEIEELVVGFYTVDQVLNELYGLDALFVEPAYIGKGVGRALIEHAKQTVLFLGGSKLEIQGDPNATHFYRAAGGRLVGERESESIAGRFLPLFVIDLSDNEAIQG